MDSKDSEFLKRIQATFRIEAEEHLKVFSTGLIDLEKTDTKEGFSGVIENMFRQVHSLKGASRSVGHKEIESVCQPLESLFSSLKKQEIEIDKALLDLFFKAHKLIAAFVAAPLSEQHPGLRQTTRELIQQLKQALPATNDAGHGTKDTGQGTRDAGHGTRDMGDGTREMGQETMDDGNSEKEMFLDFPKIDKQVFAQSVRIPISKLDPLLFQAEEFIQSKISVNQQASEIMGILTEVTEWKINSQTWRGRQSKTSVSQWSEWQEEVEVRLNNLESHLKKLSHSMERESYNLERLVNDHLEAMKQVLMLPVSSIIEVFPAMVREISQDQHKEIEFQIHGSDLEIDKRILEELKDPLIHLIRNSIDHGIGNPNERLSQNKPARGRITLSIIARESGLAEITVSDDGKGVDQNQVLKAALKSGIISKDDAGTMGLDEIRSLIFHSGLSTKSIITDLSGRGLGLSIVREKVEKLNGRLTMETKENVGTTFRILLPMTMATFRGLLVSMGEFMFIIPTMHVERVIRVKTEDIASVENHETICFDEVVLSLVNLGEVLGLSGRQRGTALSQLGKSTGSEHVRIVVLVSGVNRIAFRVDEILDEQQVLVKGLGKLLFRVRNIIGATILGSGKVVPVLNIADLMKSTLRDKGMKKETPSEEKMAAKSGKILVAEDSITSRTLIKNILETAGYEVTTAVDGVDAFTKTRKDTFDLIVSDVDMPRMNGFELTAKIKSDKKLGEIPVILVTALESRDDRERGIEAGADAYIIKSSFDQGNLLEVIKKLI